MAIHPIQEQDWDAIVDLQAEVYREIEPEPVEILRSKWLNSPSCCFVYRQQVAISAYLLAHAWSADQPPKLYQLVPSNGVGGTLFLHDLAVSHAVAGAGVGRQMVTHLLACASKAGFEKVLLVAVQGSVPFWSRLGFTVCPDRLPSPEYGASARIMSQSVSGNVKIA